MAVVSGMTVEKVTYHYGILTEKMKVDICRDVMVSCEDSYRNRQISYTLALVTFKIHTMVKTSKMD